MDDKIKELIDERGWLNASVIIEVQGNDTGYIKDALEGMVSKLEKVDHVRVYEKKFSDPVPMEHLKGIFASHVEIKLAARDFGKMVYIALMFSPSSIEFLSSKNITIPTGEAENILADISSIVTSLAHSVFAKQGEVNRLKGIAPSQKKA